MTAQEEEQKRPQPTDLPPALKAAPRLEPPIPSEPAVAPSRQFPLDKAHSDFASFHEGYVRHYIALADTKAGVIFALASGIIGYLLNDDNVQILLLSPSCSTEFVISILALLFLGVVATLAFLVFAPRLADPSKEGLVFFGAVADKTTSDKYVQDVAGSTEQDLTKARLKHCYDTASVCARKYKLLKAAILLTPLSLLFALLSTLLK